jgi:Type IV secretion system pilin
MTCPPNQTATDFGCIPNEPGGFTSKLYGIGLGLVGAAAVLFIIYGGYLILTSQGNSLQVARGKTYVMYSIIGLIFAILAAIFLQLVVVDFLHIPGFSK